ncbi:DUF7133 domain-containing protein [Gemmatirosa kalamazoonensis]|nr:c-type cytochrome [Gemmatirosa kalamazoonensis]
MKMEMSFRSGPFGGALLVASLLVGCRHEPVPQPAPAAAPAAAMPTPASTAPPAPAANPLAALYVDTGVTPVRSPQDEARTFRLVDGYRAELVAAEPLVQDPVAIDFDADGRMYVVEMRAFMPNIDGKGEDRPIGRVVVLEDTNDDGVMDRKTVFLDSLVLPRTIKVMQHGVLVGAPPNLYFARDTNADLRADVRTLVRGDYGTLSSNPEHNANGLLWGLDNWLHNANYAGEFRLQPDGSFAFRPAPEEGQWGVSSDDYGRLFRNSNEDPLRTDYIPEHYAARGGNAGLRRGVYEQVTRNTSVWPDHKTPAVNRGYREGVLRGDSSLAMFTSAGSPTVYVGDRLPDELRGSVFVTEPAGNLVARFVIEDSGDGFARARKAYERADFMTASDQRFRPVNLSSAPDGTLYVVDMYRGIIQHRAYITDYLEQKIRERGMEQPVGLGRIWRIVHTSTQRGPAPQLSRASAADLVPLLAHPNGWWRFKAQQLLVERGDRSVADALRAMIRSHRDDRARLHALWTLDGLGESDPLTIETALADSSPYVRAAAVRISEPWLARASHPLQDAVLRLADDRTPLVRRQLAASLGELTATRRDAALVTVASRYGDDPIVTDLVAGAVRGRETAFLEKLLATRGEHAAAVQSIAASIVRSRDAAAIGRLLTLAGQPSRPRWQRLALLTGANPRSGQRAPRGPRPSFEPPAGAAAGGAASGAAPEGPPRPTAAPPIALPNRPAALLAAAESPDSAIRAQARAVADALTWPGKGGAAAPAARALTADEQARYEAGRQQYTSTCAGCHQANGGGLAGVAKPLVGSRFVLGTPVRLIRIVLNGKEGEMLMPPIGGTLTDEQVANVLTYVRRSWGNDADPIEPTQVKEIRAATAGRKKPWTEAELLRITR